jgi:exodeoxyribonuclease VII small subunit
MTEERPMPDLQPKSFEEALADLEKCVQRLEEGRIGLEEALQCYEQGVGLLKHCHGLLQDAEQRILILAGVDKEGKPMTSLFDLGDAADPTNSDAPRRRRHAGPEA